MYPLQRITCSPCNYSHAQFFRSYKYVASSEWWGWEDTHRNIYILTSYSPFLVYVNHSGLRRLLLSHSKLIYVLYRKRISIRFHTCWTLGLMKCRHSWCYCIILIILHLQILLNPSLPTALFPSWLKHVCLPHQYTIEWRCVTHKCEQSSSLSSCW